MNLYDNIILQRKTKRITTVKKEIISNVLVEFLTNKSNNIKWHNYAQNRIKRTARYARVGCLSAEDYISDIKVTILDLVTVQDISSSCPRFTIIRDGETICMSSSDLMNYFSALLSLRLTNSFRREKRFVSMPYQDEVENEGTSSGDDIILGADNPGEEFTVSFNDPFEKSQIYLSKEFIEECCRVLEEENILFRMIFEELLNGNPNRMIAGKYKLSVRRVENIRKIINRRVRKLRG
jgi:hypothetical protein